MNPWSQALGRARPTRCRRAAAGEMSGLIKFLSRSALPSFAHRTCARQSPGLKKAERRVALLEHAPASQWAESFGERVLVVVLDDEHAAVAQQCRCVRAELAERQRVVRSVRRVEEDYVPRLCPCAPVALALARALQVFGGLALDDLGQLFGHAEQVEVLLDERAHLVHAVNEGDEGRAARKRLDADGPRPGAEVEEARASDSRREDVEECLAQAV